MSRIRIQNFSVSPDGCGAGPGQDLENPIGVGGLALLRRFFATRAFRRMHGQNAGETGIDNEIALPDSRIEVHRKFAHRSLCGSNPRFENN